jgi:glycosyltransferase involved in cell wall biosynthesis
LDTIARIFAMRSRILMHSPDIVIGFMHSMFIPLCASMLGIKTKLIASEHIIYDHYNNVPLQKLLLLLSSFFITRITCVSVQALLTYPFAIRRKMVAISNPVRIEINGHAHAFISERARKVLLSVGRLEMQKDHAILIKAFSKIADQVQDWDLRIIGEGDLRAQLEMQISKLGLGERIQLPGPTRDIAKEYLSAQLFVVSSRYESFGLATAEALAHGLPVVGFADCPGTNELVREGRNGLLADGTHDRAASLAAALCTLMTDDQLRASLSERSSDILDNFRLERVLDRWELLIEKTIAA